jgi:hypothetical protein
VAAGPQQQHQQQQQGAEAAQQQWGQSPWLDAYPTQQQVRAVVGPCARVAPQRVRWRRSLSPGCCMPAYACT